MNFFIHYPVLGIGGAERSLIRLSDYLINHGHDVTLLLTTKGGQLESELNKKIKIIYLRKKAYGVKFKRSVNLFEKLKAVPDAFMYFYERGREYIVKQSLSKIKYDVAIVMIHSLRPATCMKYIQYNKLFQWIRNDLGQYPKNDRFIKILRQYSEDIDAYICVSQVARDSIAALEPKVDHKAYVVHNFYNTSEIIELSNRGEDPYLKLCGNETRIVTVGRLLDADKAIFRILDACEILVARKLKFIWFLIGDGPDKAEMEDRIKKRGLSSFIYLLGAKENPYPYYKWADFSATLSNYEGLCGVVSEAKVLNKAVIATRFSGIEEQLENNINGLIVEQNIDSIVTGLQLLIGNKEVLHRLAKKPLPAVLLDNSIKYNKLLSLILN